MSSPLEIESGDSAAEDSECPIVGNGRGRSLIHWLLVIFSVIATVVGQSAGTLLSRYYFNQGGGSRWLQTLLPCVGWPILFIPVVVNRLRRKRTSTPSLLQLKFVVWCGGLGVMGAGYNMLYSWGVSYLPVSTFSLLSSTQLAFTAVFALVLVRQRMSPYILNSLVAITFGAVLLAVHSNGNRPEGVSNREYAMGFVYTISASALFALSLPLTQLVFKNVVGDETYGVVVETQALIYGVASVVAAIGLLASGEFRGLKTEARGFEAGRVAYYMTLLWTAIGWQTCFLGIFGLVFLVSSLFSNVISTLTLPLTSILAVVFFHDKIDAIQVMAMLLSLWGFVSYVFGGIQDSKDAQRSS